MSYRLDYQEPLPNVIERMNKEHAEFKAKLERIQRAVNERKMPVALSLLMVLKTEVLRHAVEEEAVLARFIMKNARKESSESVRILQEHRKITHFFDDVLPSLQRMNEPEARKHIDEFISFLMSHHFEEECIVFPLVIGRDSLFESGNIRAKSCSHLEVTVFGSHVIKDLLGKKQKVMLERCSRCGTYLTMDGMEIPSSRIEESEA